MSLAGTLTTAISLSRTSLQILYDPRPYARRMNEINSRVVCEGLTKNQPISLQVLESVLLLNACLYEGLRHGYGTTNRHIRVRPYGSIVYTTNPKLSTSTTKSKTFMLPPGTPVSMSTVSHHSHTCIWPESQIFNLDRFLPIDTVGSSGMTGHALFQKYVGSFNAGTRQCVGINLAQIEILMGLAELFRRFGGDVEGKGDNPKVLRGMRVAHWLDQERDVTIKRDLVVPLPGPDSRGIWIELHS